MSSFSAIFAIQLTVYIYQKYINIDLFIYSFYILKFLTVFRKTVETGMDLRLRHHVGAHPGL